MQKTVDNTKSMNNYLKSILNYRKELISKNKKVPDNPQITSASFRKRSCVHEIDPNIEGQARAHTMTSGSWSRYVNTSTQNNSYTSQPVIVQQRAPTDIERTSLSLVVPVRADSFHYYQYVDLTPAEKLHFGEVISNRISTSLYEELRDYIGNPNRQRVLAVINQRTNTLNSKRVEFSKQFWEKELTDTIPFIQHDSITFDKLLINKAMSEEYFKNVRRVFSLNKMKFIKWKNSKRVHLPFLDNHTIYKENAPDFKDIGFVSIHTVKGYFQSTTT